MTARTQPGRRAPGPDTGSGQLAGRIALVSGAGHNIGEAIARRFASEGAAVAVADIDEAAATRVADLIVAAGGRACPAVGDLATVDGVDQVFDEVERHLGVVDALVNNAYARIGESCFEPFLSVEPADWQRFIAANTTMFFACAQRTARTLASQQRPGTIVNISSHGAARAHRQHIPYDSVKGAMEAFTRAVAVDLAPWGIRSNCVRPGSIVVDGENWTDEDADDVRSAQIPMGRPGTVNDVAGAVLYLTSNESAYVTGQVFNIDGGMSVQARAPQVEPGIVASPATLTGFPPRLQQNLTHKL
ncbi:SDR family NAD(P)-dependent oxidoreductase [Rhodococcus sp. NPDC056960]|uniref:SDR family NAD(P)-dependent oxidoreductase n=1 Tax=Rhodococcus sp. NPDC056960 TaxID=3345982 RepID=UPI00363CF30C